MAAILHVTIPPYIIKTMSSDSIREGVIPNNNPWSAIVRRKIPATITIQVVPVTVVDYIIGATYRY